MSKKQEIRNLKRRGENVTEISRKTGVCRDTVYKYLNVDDFSLPMPVIHKRSSKLDPYKPIIISWLEEDKLTWKKQQHTAHRIWTRLQEEYEFDGSESLVRMYVKNLKIEIGGLASGEQYLDLTWEAGIAQADFGEADFVILGVKVRLSFFVLSFPYSNVGLAQIFFGENAECVCTGLKTIFEAIGGVPRRIIFDNATGVGRRIADEIRTTELFGAFATHYGFEFSFCNPYSGHEKGSVERKVATIRANLFVPVPRIENLEVFNGRLIERCLKLSEKTHWLKNQKEIELFAEDCFALLGLPPKAFNVMRYERVQTNKQGKFQVDGKHFYSSDPDYKETELIIGISAFTVEVYDAKGTYICTHKRAYGSAPSDTCDPASQIALLCKKAGAWQQSKVRESLPEDIRAYFDGLEKPELRQHLRLLRDVCACQGWQATKSALIDTYTRLGRIDDASLKVAAERSGQLCIQYTEQVDLSVYDQAINLVPEVCNDNPQ